MYAGATTGRDGIHGATMSSSEVSVDEDGRTSGDASWRSIP